MKKLKDKQLSSDFVLTESEKKKLYPFVFKCVLRHVIDKNFWALVEMREDREISYYDNCNKDSNEICKVFLGTKFEMPVYGEDGYSQYGRDRDGYDRKGFDEKGRDRNGFDKNGYDSWGYDRKGYNKAGFNRKGFNRKGFNKEGRDRGGYDKKGFNEEGYDEDGYGKNGYNKDGVHRKGYTEQMKEKYKLDDDGYTPEGYDIRGYKRDGRDINGHTKEGHVNEGGIGCNSILGEIEKEGKYREDENNIQQDLGITVENSENPGSEIFPSFFLDNVDNR